MKLIGKAWTADDYCEPSCDFFTVDLDRNFARYILKYMDLCQQMKNKDHDVYQIELWNQSCDFYAYSDAVAEQFFSGHKDVTTYRSLPDMRISEDEQPRVDCVTLHIAPDEIHWECFIKHTTILVTTARIPRSMVKKAAAPPKKKRNVA